MRMKKGTMLLLAIAVIASLLMIIALGGVEEPSISSTPQSEAESAAIELPDGFKPIAQAQGEDLYDTDQAVDKATAALGDIGVSGNVNFTFGNLEESQLCTFVDLYAPTRAQNLIVHLMRLTTQSNNEWEVESIVNAENKHFYYVSGNSAGLGK